MTERFIKALNTMIEELRFEIDQHESDILAWRRAAIDIDESWSNVGEIYRIGFSPASGKRLDKKYEYAASLPDGWRKYNFKEIEKAILAQAPEGQTISAVRGRILAALETAVNRFNSVVSLTPSDQYLSDLHNKIKELYKNGCDDSDPLDAKILASGVHLGPHSQILRYSINPTSRLMVAARDICRTATSAVEHLELARAVMSKQIQSVGNKVFIGHGRSPLWLKLKDFIQMRLGLPWDEFNRVPIAGVATAQRLSEMLDDATFAFLVFTAEDKIPGEGARVRENVVHEAGLFQGRLGFRRAIILIEAGCGEFSNIHGLGQIQFPRGNIEATFEQLRQVLEREGVVVSHR